MFFNKKNKKNLQQVQEQTKIQENTNIRCPICNDEYEIFSQKEINQKYALYDYLDGGYREDHNIVREKSHDLETTYICNNCGHTYKKIKKNIPSSISKDSEYTEISDDIDHIIKLKQEIDRIKKNTSLKQFDEDVKRTHQETGDKVIIDYEIPKK